MGAPTSSSERSSTTGWPSNYDNNGFPMNKRYGYESSSYNQYVYNSALEMNAVIYLIKKAAVSGINPH